MHDTTARETTTRINREELSEGWAEMDRVPRVLATVKLGAKTDLGRIRENNEDKFDFHEPEDPSVLATKGSFYAVADGMGGHSAGQIACEMALKTVVRSYYANPSADIDASLRHAIEDANSMIFDTAQMIPERHGMGTTLTAAIIREDRLTVAQVGDSRAYLIHEGQITQITQDHSWVAEQVRMGVMTMEEAQASPFRNIITRSIGTSATVDPDILTHPLEAGDVLVLCSDGLSGYLEPAEIEAIALEHSPSVAAARLVDEANERGGRDNVTTLILAVRAIAPYTGAAAPDAEPAAGTDQAAEPPEKRGWRRRK